MPSKPDEGPVTLATVARLWLPLALSWLLMSAEIHIFTGFVARMPESKVNLAAFGSVVFPLALVVEAPIIMLLAASTALVRDRDSYRKLHRFTTVSGFLLTGLHLLVALTPLYGILVEDLIRVPQEVVGPARTGLLWMTPWTWAIAYRRFQQGVLIARGRSQPMVWGTLVRLAFDFGVLAFLSSTTDISGISAGTAAIASGVTAEALFIGYCARPTVRELPAPRSDAEPLTRSSFLHFYVPLAMTPLLTLLIQPIGSAAMSRMPDALSSLAAWTPVHALVFLVRSLGFAFNEVVVALLDRPGARPALLRFTSLLALGTMAVLAALAATPLSRLWFEEVSGLDPELGHVCATALFFALLMPGYQAVQSYHQGSLVHARRTRGVTESVALYLVVSASILAAGTVFDPLRGIYFALIAFTTGGVLQTAWLVRRSRQLPRHEIR